MNRYSPLFFIVLFFNTCFLYAMEMHDIEKNKKAITSKNEHAVIADYLVEHYKLQESESLHPFLIENIKKLQTDKPSKYRLLKKMSKNDHKKTDKTSGTLKKTASTLIMNSFNEYTIACDRTIASNRRISHVGLGGILFETGIFISLFVAILSTGLANC